jgi:hypothetical protein
VGVDVQIGEGGLGWRAGAHTSPIICPPEGAVDWWNGCGLRGWSGCRRGREGSGRVL